MERRARFWRRLRDRLERTLRAHPRAAAALLGVALLAVLLRTAWVAEDAFITFRSVEQLLAGNGPRWNPHERVQSFTHPLWFGLLAAGRAATGDAYWAALALNLACAAAALALLLLPRRGAPWRAAWLAALLVSSKAWVDYATSGLENALSYLLLAGFLLAGRRLAWAPERIDAARAAGVLALAFALALNRIDTLALTLPAVGWIAWRARARRGATRALAALALAALPLAAWTGFSLVYFGFPLPNTAYAKLNTGIPVLELLAQGGHYLANSLRWDPATLVTLLAAVAVSWRTRGTWWPAVALGLLLHVAYVLRVGGDFMSGRFLAAPHVAAALLFVECAGPRARRALALLLLALPFVSPSHPLRFTDFEKREDEHGVADERSFYADATSLGTCIRRARAGLRCPDHEWTREGREFGLSDEPLVVRSAIGMFGYAAGIDAIIIDSLALTDPLLARLPVDGSWRIGHFWRRMPAGYAASVLTGRNQIRDPALREWYGQLVTITQGPLFSRERWVTIARMNAGAYEPLLEAHRRASP